MSRTSSLVRGMVHTNGNVICAIDIETTTLDTKTAEIIEIAIIPVDSKLEPSQVVFPFHIKMKPEHLEDVDAAALEVSRKTLADVMLHGISQDEGCDLFHKWFDNLRMPMGKKLMPLGHNYNNYDRGIIEAWLGSAAYQIMFHHHVRDTLCAAIWINDRCNFEQDKFPFTRLSLGDICRLLKINRGSSHTALDDALSSLKVYKHLLAMPTGLEFWTGTLIETETLKTDFKA